MTMQQIKPAEVTRDEDGEWLHPDLPTFDEDDPLAFGKWLEAPRLDWAWETLEDSAPEDVCDRYFEHCDTDISYWHPEKPEGEGWFCLGIYHAEDGPICCWVRPIELSGQGPAS